MLPANPAPASWGEFPLSEKLRLTVARSRRMPANWLGLRLALFLRHRAKRNCRGPLDAEALGVRLRLFPEDNFCENRLLFMPQFYDPEEFRFLAKILTAESSFVDIGANVGIYSLVVAKRLAPRGRVLAVEPDPITFSRLTTNLHLNNLAHVTPRQAAVGDKPGLLHLHRHARNRGQNELRQDGDGQTAAVAVLPLATLLTEARCEAPTALKIDIEGMEEIVFSAFFADAPERIRPLHLITEEPRKQPRAALQALLVAAGYEKIGQTRTNSIWRRTG